MFRFLAMLSLALVVLAVPTLSLANGGGCATGYIAAPAVVQYQVATPCYVAPVSQVVAQQEYQVVAQPVVQQVQYQQQVVAQPVMQYQQQVYQQQVVAQPVVQYQRQYVAAQAVVAAPIVQYQKVYQRANVVAQVHGYSRAAVVARQPLFRRPLLNRRAAVSANVVVGAY